MHLDHTPVPLSEWRALFNRVPRSNLLQSYDYARAVALVEHLRPKWARIIDENQTIGIVQILTTGMFWGAIHAVLIDRGPLWLDGCGTAAQITRFWQLINAEYPARFGRKRRFIPECSIPAALENTGLRPVARVQPYQTIWLNLAPSTDDLRAQLAGNWRNHLNNAERAGVTVTITTELPAINRAIMLMDHDRRTRAYRGAGARLLRALAASFSGTNNVFVASAIAPDGEVVATGLFFIHGCCATWQTGWAGPRGRDLNANYAMLWQTILHLKNRDVVALDLGGVNDEDAKGIRDFKVGLRGENVTFIGQYA